MSKVTKSIRVMILTAAIGSFTIVAHANYHYGDTGAEVKAIQKELKAAGYSVKETGNFDGNTQWAVRQFQKSHKLKETGEVESKTYETLLRKPMPTAQPVKAKKVKAPKKSKKDKLKEEKISARELEARARGGDSHLPKVVGISSKDIVFHDKLNLSKKEKKVLDIASSYKGVPYVFGGTTPTGFDCSGYIRYVFAHAGIELPRAADEQYKVGKTVRTKDLKPGDLVFFETYEAGVSHSGIYMGNGKFISATSSRGVAVANMVEGYWAQRYIGAKRIIP